MSPAEKRIQLLERELRAALDALIAVAELVKTGKTEGKALVLDAEAMEQCTATILGVLASRLQPKERA